MKKYSSLLVYLSCFLASFFLVIAGFSLWQGSRDNHEVFVPHPLQYELDPPAQSLIGKVLSLTGTSRKQPRDAEADVTSMDKDSLVLEGESIEVSEKSALTVTFPLNAQIAMEAQTMLAFISTNPAHFLVKQDRGVVTYKTGDSIKSIAIRSLHSLLMLNGEKAIGMIKVNMNEIVFRVVSGTGEIGYLGKDNNTKTVELKAGQTAIFDDKNRTILIK